VLHGAGLTSVTQISVADHWNALRWRPTAEAAAAGQAGAEVPPADLLPVGRHATLAYRMVRLVTVPALRVAFRFEIHGRENIPRTGTYIVIANHLGWLDALTLAMVFPVEPRIHFLADPTGMMRRRLEWALIRATGGIIPVDRAQRQAEGLIRQVNRCLELGGAVALFPEGDFGPREGEVLPFKKGFAHFAVGAGVAVVPVGLSGPKDVWLGKRIGVYIGEPIQSAGKTVDEISRLHRVPPLEIVTNATVRDECSPWSPQGTFRYAQLSRLSSALQFESGEWRCSWLSAIWTEGDRHRAPPRPAQFRPLRRGPRNRLQTPRYAPVFAANSQRAYNAPWHRPMA